MTLWWRKPAPPAPRPRDDMLVAVTVDTLDGPDTPAHGTLRVIVGPRCRHCQSVMARPVHQPRDTCTTCRATGTPA